MKRLFDFILSTILICTFALPMILIAITIILTSKGPVLYWSDRVGIDNIIFKMPKFRSMHEETPSVATHLLTNTSEFLSPIGRFLRSMSLDELPQLFSILKGDMSFVGPRPALFNQKDLINLRKENGLHKLIPGVTGWAQVNGRDELTIEEKVQFDLEYIQKKSFWFDLKIIGVTIFKVLKRDGVSH